MDGERMLVSKSPSDVHEPQLDSLRGVLIILVVLGHILEAGFNDPLAKMIWEVIYVFHMPAFLFVSGMLSRFNPAKIARGLLIPYFVFQTLYLLFSRFVSGSSESLVIQYSTPSYLTWYLISLAYYRIAVPFLDMAKTGRQRAAVLGALIAIALLAPLDGTMGRQFSAARTLSFAPFFAAGFYWNKERGRAGETARMPVLVAAVLVVFILCCYQIKVNGYGAEVLRGVASYSDQFQPTRKVRLLIHGAAWIALLITAVPKWHIPIITKLGSNTMPVFLLHGFATNYLYAENMQLEGLPFIALAALLAPCLAVALSSTPASWLVSVLCFGGRRPRCSRTTVHAEHGKGYDIIGNDANEGKEAR